MHNYCIRVSSKCTVKRQNIKICQYKHFPYSNKNLQVVQNQKRCLHESNIFLFKLQPECILEKTRQNNCFFERVLLFKK